MLIIFSSTKLSCCFPHFHMLWNSWCLKSHVECRFPLTLLLSCCWQLLYVFAATYDGALEQAKELGIKFSGEPLLRNVSAMSQSDSKSADESSGRHQVCYHIFKYPIHFKVVVLVMLLFISQHLLFDIGFAIEGALILICSVESLSQVLLVKLLMPAKFKQSV